MLRTNDLAMSPRYAIFVSTVDGVDLAFPGEIPWLTPQSAIHFRPCGGLSLNVIHRDVTLDPYSRGMTQAGCRTATAAMTSARTPVRAARTPRDDESSRVTDLIYEAVLAGEFLAGRPLPAERDLADALQTSRNSLRDALQRLAHAGLVRRQRGRGTYVITRSPVQRLDEPRYFERAFGPVRSVAADSARIGFRVLDADRSPGPAVLAHLLDLPAGAPVIRLARLVLVADRPVGYWTCYVPCRPGDDPDLIRWRQPVPFDDLIARHRPDGPLTEHIALQARQPTPASARHLQIGPTEPVLVLRRRFIDDAQRIVAMCIGHCIEPGAVFEVHRPATALTAAG